MADAVDQALGLVLGVLVSLSSIGAGAIGLTTALTLQRAGAEVTLGGAGGALGWMATEWVHRKRPSTFGLLSGCIAGLVAITPACGFVQPVGALPSLIYIWENASERAFHERTAAAIIVLLVFMIIMNAAAIILRRRFERRW